MSPEAQDDPGLPLSKLTSVFLAIYTPLSALNINHVGFKLGSLLKEKLPTPQQ